jgi:hypothetical protein
MPDVKTPPAGQPPADSTRQYCRAWVRFAPRQQTSCHLITLTEDSCWPALVQNLSTNGVGLHLDEPVSVGRFVLVELVSASGLFSRLLLTRVVHLSQTVGGGYLLGGEFISELPDSELKFLLA